jgi:transposase
MAPNDRLRHPLLKLRRLQFGRKSRRLLDEKLQLGLEDLEAAIAKDDAEAERRASRGALPAHLPRIEVELAPPVIACPCCQARMAVTGKDISARLDVIPALFRVLVTRRPKLACRACPNLDR